MMKAHKCKKCDGKGYRVFSSFGLSTGRGMSKGKKEPCTSCEGTGTNTRGYDERNCRKCKQGFVTTEPFTRTRHCPDCEKILKADAIQIKRNGYTESKYGQ